MRQRASVKETSNIRDRIRKMLFNFYQCFYCCVNDDSLQQTGELKTFWIGRLSTVLNRFHQKYAIRHVASFISEELTEINLGMFAVIVNLSYYVMQLFFSPISHTTQTFLLKEMVFRQIQQRRW